MVPGLSPDDLASAQELVYAVSEHIRTEGLRTVDIPRPSFRPTGITAANEGVTVEEKFIGVYIGRTSSTGADATSFVLINQGGDDHFEEIVPEAGAGRIEHNFAPLREDESWIVVAIYSRGTAQASSINPFKYLVASEAVALIVFGLCRPRRFSNRIAIPMPGRCHTWSIISQKRESKL
jgi:hypothetical protein